MRLKHYVQVPIFGARIAPMLQDFRSSETAFFEVLELYRPNRIIVWGKRLYNNLPQRGQQLPDLELPDGNAIETWGYLLSNGEMIRLLPIQHPSSGFVWEYWHAVIQAFFNK